MRHTHACNADSKHLLLLNLTSWASAYQDFGCRQQFLIDFEVLLLRLAEQWLQCSPERSVLRLLTWKQKTILLQNSKQYTSVSVTLACAVMSNVVSPKQNHKIVNWNSYVSHYILICICSAKQQWSAFLKPFACCRRRKHDCKGHFGQTTHCRMMRGYHVLGFPKGIPYMWWIINTCCSISHNCNFKALCILNHIINYVLERLLSINI